MLKILFLFLITSYQVIFASNLSCKDKQLFSFHNTSSSSKELDVSADKTNFKNKDIYHLTGNAEISAANYYLGADDITVVKSKKTMNAKGNVRIKAMDMMAVADSINIKKDGNHITANSKNIKFKYLKTGANGRTTAIDSKNNVHTLDEASYSFCPDGAKKWQIKAKKIILDQNKNRGTAQDVKLELFGIPIFYMPSYEWVLKGRESGFLFSSISSYSIGSEKGYQVDIPYYFNLAPNRDLTLTLKNLSTRGNVINGFYRHLLANNKDDGYLESTLEYIADDRKADKKRWLVDTNFNYKINDNLKLDLSLNRVSDKLYFKEIAHKNKGLETLYSQIRFDYKNQDLRAYIFNEKEQVVGSGTNTYSTDLEVFLKKSFKHKYADIKASITRTDFNHKDKNKIQGIRTNTDISAKKVIKTGSYSITPSINLVNTSYNLDNAKDTDRTTYNAGIDSKLFLERNTNFFGKSLTQTLVPRLSYIYSPKKNQDNLPNFDTNEKNLTYDNLFIGKKYVGLDKIADKNQVTVGLESDFIDNDNGNTYLNLQLARSFRIDNGNKSNIFAGALFSLGKFNLSHNIQYNSGVVASNSTISYKENGIKFISLSKHTDIDNNKSASLYAAVPLSGKSHIFAGINRSLSENITNYHTVGLMYDSCCMAVRLAHFKEYDDGSYDRQVKFEIIFKGLGSSDKNLYKKIAKDIPNYLPEL